MNFKKISVAVLAAALAATASLSGCGGIDEDATAATIDGTTITLGFANFVARYTQAGYDSFFASYYGDDYWDRTDLTEEEEETFEENVKGYIMESLEMYYLLEAHMGDYGVEITEDEEAAIAEAAEKFISENTKAAIGQMGATREYVERMLYLETVQDKMTAAIEAEADTDVSDEEAAQRTFTYVSIDSAGYTDDNDEYQEYSDEEAAEVKEEAEAFQKAAEEDFDAAAENYGYTTSTYSYGSDEASEDDGGFNEEVITAADELSEGKVSDLIETDSAYYVLRLDSEYDEEATETKRASIVTERQDEYYEEVTEGYKEEADFEINEKNWAKVKFKDLFDIVSSDDGSAESE